MQIESQVGPQLLSDGSVTALRLGRTGEQVVTELHGKYYEQAVRGNVFWATMTAGVILPAVGATAANAMTLANPAGSGRNLSLIGFDMVVTTINATPATGLYGLYVNTNIVAAAVSGTAIVPIPGLVGSNYQPVAKPFSTSTVPAAPTLLKPFGYKETGGVVGAVPITGLPGFHIDFDGTVVLVPGTAITPQTGGTADSTQPVVLCSFCWEELVI
jgi:hypothetical protein